MSYRLISDHYMPVVERRLRGEGPRAGVVSRTAGHRVLRRRAGTSPAAVFRPARPARRRGPSDVRPPGVRRGRLSARRGRTPGPHEVHRVGLRRATGDRRGIAAAGGGRSAEARGRVRRSVHFF